MNNMQFSYEHELEETLKRANLYGEVERCGNDCLSVNIEWGDWKHDHLRCDYLLDEFCKMYHLICKKITVVPTNSDGSDCYSAVHFLQFLEVSI